MRVEGEDLGTDTPFPDQFLDPWRRDGAYLTDRLGEDQVRSHLLESGGIDLVYTPILEHRLPHRPVDLTTGEPLRAEPGSRDAGTVEDELGRAPGRERD